ncbi:MAG TPA: glycosyltransferase family 4 protein [Acetobacteraceae bacterium]|nr:glycosyltransferase family 4 protein [Acetobacteraceae bacterium]
MRVLFITHELALNGAVTALLAQTRALIAAGEQVSVLTPPLMGPAAALRKTFLAAGARLISKAEAREHDVAVGCTILAADALARLVGHLPVVWWIHEGAIGVQYMMANPGAYQLLDRVNRLVFPSRGTVDHVWAVLLSPLPPGRVEVIPALVSPPVPGVAAEKAAGRVRVLCVGSIYPRKRQADLLAAIVALGPSAPVECVLAGERVMLEHAAQSLLTAHANRFVLTGGLTPTALQTFYRSADIFVLPSSDESMPIAPIEAASHGIPVILSDLSCYDGVWRHGVNTLLYPVGDVELLTWSLRMLIDSPGLRVRLGTAGRTLAARFGPARTTALFAAMLAEVIAG